MSMSITNCSLKLLYLSWTYRNYKETEVAWPVNFTASGSDLFLSRTEKHSVPGTKDSNRETYDKCLTR